MTFDFVDWIALVTPQIAAGEADPNFTEVFAQIMKAIVEHNLPDIQDVSTPTSCFGSTA